MNHLRHPEQGDHSAVVVRVLLCAYLLWKTMSYDWAAVAAWPEAAFDSPFHAAWPLGPDRLLVEQVVVVGLLMAAAIGWRLRWTATAAAIVLIDMTATHYAVTNAASTFLLGTVLLLLFGLDDGIRDDEGWFRVTPMRTYTLLLGLAYFGSGWAKLQAGGLAWATSENLARLIQAEALMHLDGIPWLGQVLVDHPALAQAAAAGTLLLELGLLVALFADRLVAPILLGLVLLHVAIALAMEIWFFDQLILIGLLLPFGRADRWGRWPGLAVAGLHDLGALGSRPANVPAAGK